VHQIELEMQNRDLRESQAELEESRDRYADLYDFAPVSYATFDGKGCIRECNLRLAAMLGVERLKLTGQPFAGFVSDTSAFFNHLSRCRKSGIKENVELNLATGGGSEVTLLMFSTPEHDADGITCFRSSIIDISGRKEAEEELKKAQALLVRSEKLAAIGTPSSGVAHEILNPLNIISAIAQFIITLRREGPEKEKNP